METLAKLNYLPLPIVTLNQIEIDKEVPLTPEELKEQQLARERRFYRRSARNSMSPTPQKWWEALRPKNPLRKWISLVPAALPRRSRSPALPPAEDLPPPSVRYEPKVFPHQFLMLGLSMEEDALYVTELGLKALPRLTESGKRPKVLLIDGNSPLEKRISQAFEKSLTLAALRRTVSPWTLMPTGESTSSSSS